MAASPAGAATRPGSFRRQDRSPPCAAIARSGPTGRSHAGVAISTRSQRRVGRTRLLTAAGSARCGPTVRWRVRPRPTRPMGHSCPLAATAASALTEPLHVGGTKAKRPSNSASSAECEPAALALRPLAVVWHGWRMLREAARVDVLAAQTSVDYVAVSFRLALFEPCGRPKLLQPPDVEVIRWRGLFRRALSQLAAFPRNPRARSCRLACCTQPTHRH